MLGQLHDAGNTVTLAHYLNFMGMVYLSIQGMVYSLDPCAPAIGPSAAIGLPATPPRPSQAVPHPLPNGRLLADSMKLMAFLTGLPGRACDQLI